MPVLRQITACTEPATRVVERRKGVKGRPVEYRMALCRRHRWLAWSGGQRAADGDTGRCGTVIDYRPYRQIVDSHVDEWLRPRVHEAPQDHGDDVAAALRAAHSSLLTGLASLEWRRPTEMGYALAAALDHAARLAEAVADGALDAEAGQVQLLTALSVAEAIDATERGVS
ncbi:hypothetical protein ACIPJN_28960 [Streptomyces sp. NPDC086796]|uniref:hypothetical protein n=1 Tax=Streptomyces sp. NPDC086796 TaxID=3365760 RepID=UPI00381A321F